MVLEMMGGVPHTSEFVKRCLTRYGLPGAFQSYVRINERRAEKQRALLESNFAGGKEKSDQAKNVENKLLSLLFEFVVTPVEAVATIVGQGKQIQTFNNSLGAADWVYYDTQNHSFISEAEYKKHEKEMKKPQGPGRSGSGKDWY